MFPKIWWRKLSDCLSLPRKDYLDTESRYRIVHVAIIPDYTTKEQNFIMGRINLPNGPEQDDILQPFSTATLSHTS